MGKKAMGGGGAGKGKGAKGGTRGGKAARSPGSGVGGGSGQKPKHSMDPVGRPKGGAGGQRSEATVRRLAMYKQRPVRDAKGKVLFEQYQSKVAPNTRIIPDRRWFGNTRVVGQAALEGFRQEMAAASTDAYAVVLKAKTLPLALLADPEKAKRPARADLLGVAPFADTFGAKAQRKRPAVKAETYEEMLLKAAQGEAEYDTAQEAGPRGGAFAPVAPWLVPSGAETLARSDADGARAERRDGLFAKGQSKRIWGELYKVVDSSDVLIQVLDARDPIGTRCAHLEAHLKERTQRHRHMVLVLNKCDLVPAWVTKRWLHALSREYPTVAFHASMTHPFGKGALLSLLRQFQRLHADKPNISVGFIGYPNVGKSSVINTLRTKKVCVVAPVPGQTKVWQYVNLTKKIFLIDCPGVVYSGAGDSDTDAVLKGVVRVANLEDAAEHVGAVLGRVKPEYLRRAYRISAWDDSHDFLCQLARLSGKLLRGGEPDTSTAAKALLQDWQRGRIPYFQPPPALPARDAVIAAPVAPAPLPPTADPAARAAATAERAAFREAEIVAGHAAEALRRQVQRGLPGAKGMFSPEDAANPDGDDGDADVAGDDYAPSDDGGSEDDGEDESDEEEDEEAEADGDADAPDADVAAAAGDDGDESDGYGSEGLTWEAVMADLKGAAKGSAPVPPAGGAKAGKGSAAPAPVAGKKAKAAAGGHRERRAALDAERSREAARAAAAAAEAEADAPAAGKRRRGDDDEPGGKKGKKGGGAGAGGEAKKAKAPKAPKPALGGMFTSE